MDAKDRVDTKCTQWNCRIVLKMQQLSVYNLKSHCNSQHPTLLNELLANIEGESKRGRHFSGTSEPESGVSGISIHSQKRQRQSSIEAALKEKFSQKKALNL